MEVSGNGGLVFSFYDDSAGSTDKSAGETQTWMGVNARPCHYRPEYLGYEYIPEQRRFISSSGESVSAKSGDVRRGDTGTCALYLSFTHGVVVLGHGP